MTEVQEYIVLQIWHAWIVGWMDGRMPKPPMKPEFLEGVVLNGELWATVNVAHFNDRVTVYDVSPLGEVKPRGLLR